MRRSAGILALLIAGTALAQTDARRSGYEAMSADTRALQDNDRANPAMLWVAEGERLWNTPAGEGLRSCAGCHGAAEKTMAGVAARYPAFSRESGLPVDLQGRILACRTEQQKAPAWAYESRPLLAMTAYVGLQSRGKPLTPPQDLRLSSYLKQGSALFSQPLGQLDLSCAQCHDANAGRRLGAAPIPQAHPTGYPIYRLEWQGVGSLQRRLRNCMTGVRAEPFAYGSPELIALELHLMQRAAGMAVETPAVRP